MAGDWIKVEHVTPDKPEIYQIAGLLNVTPEDAFGRCMRIWIWADQQSLNGHAINVTFVTLSSIARHASFAEALANVGWLVDNGDGTVTFPNFENHNGETAKKRAVDNKRQKNHRDKKNKDVTEESRNERDKSVTREEKRRDKYIPPISPELLKDFLQVRKAKRAGTLTETAFKGIIREAGIAGISTEDAVRICCERNWVSFKANWDWQSVSLGSERKRELSL
jgi:hypothetical protein